MEHVSIDLWAVNLEVRPPDLPSWLAQLEQRLAATAARGAHMLVLPEFACAEWLAFAPVDLQPTAQLEWLSGIGEGALEQMAALATQYGVSLLPGTIPHRRGEQAGQPVFANRAWLLTPDGAAFHQDKLSLTPLEENGASGVTVRGDRINVFRWNGLRVAIVICLDAEFTDLWSRLGTLDLDLVLIPAKTDMITGYHRVFSCARARAIELQTPVCVVGAVGEPLGHPHTDTGVGGAAAYLPCDVSVSLDGIFATLPPQTAAAATNAVLPVQNLPVGACRRLRRGGAEAEVRPALWEAGHLEVADA